MPNKKIYFSVGAQQKLRDVLKKFNWSFVDKVEEADIALFPDGPRPWLGWCGEVIRIEKVTSPFIRDSIEVSRYMKAVREGVPCLGLGRGAILLGLLNGASLREDKRDKNSPFLAYSKCLSQTFKIGSNRHSLSFGDLEKVRKEKLFDYDLFASGHVYDAFFEPTKTLCVIPTLAHEIKSQAYLDKIMSEMEQ